jgi:hypothetical protein
MPLNLNLPNPLSTRSHNTAQDTRPLETSHNTMDRRGAPEFILEAFADPNSVRDVVKGEFPFR